MKDKDKENHLIDEDRLSDIDPGRDNVNIDQVCHCKESIPLECDSLHTGKDNDHRGNRVEFGRGYISDDIKWVKNLKREILIE
jgi:hypothetical protein